MKFTTVALTVTLVGALATLGYAQRGFRLSPQLATADSFDGDFHYCRVAYRSNPYGDGGSWSTDYPDADANLSIRLGELTRTRISRHPSGAPNHLIVRLTDDELFRCPFTMMQEVGTFFIDATEAARLRDYLLKGGFLWVDDFWGSYAWEVWAEQIAKALPPSEFPIVDLPNDHPIFRSQYTLRDGVPQVPSINHWLGTGGGTSERGADSADVHARAIFDPKGRMIVFMTHNTDVSDSWEREGEDPNYFYTFSVNGYAVAVNVLLHAMTH
jgi:hypothetical protein